MTNCDDDLFIKQITIQNKSDYPIPVSILGYPNPQDSTIDQSSIEIEICPNSFVSVNDLQFNNPVLTNIKGSKNR